MHRKLFAVLSILAVLTMLVGCAVPAPEVVEKEVIREVEVEKVVTAEPPPIVEIEFGQYEYESANTAMHAIIESFEAVYPNIKVNYVGIPYEEYNEKIAALVPAGQGPDIVKPY